MTNELENFARGMGEIRSYLRQWRQDHLDGRGSVAHDAPSNTLGIARDVANKIMVQVIEGLIAGQDPRHQAQAMVLALQDPSKITAVTPNGPEEIREQRRQLDRHTEHLKVELQKIENSYRTLQSHCKHPALFYTGFNPERLSNHYCPDCGQYSNHIGPPSKGE